MPQHSAFMYPTTVAARLASIPSQPRIDGAATVTTTAATTSPWPIHSAWRASGAASARRPAPSSCDTIAGNAIRTPEVNSITDAQMAPPSAMAASASALSLPAITVSMKFSPTPASWPPTSGPARRTVCASSRAVPAAGEGSKTTASAPQSGSSCRSSQA